MKKILLLCTILISIQSQAQQWQPREQSKPVKPVVEKEQCWGTTAKQVRCKKMIDTTKAGKYIKVLYNNQYIIYYCAQHAKQIHY